MSRSFRLLALAVLAVVLGLSAAQSVSAQQVFLNPTFGFPGTLVTVTGSGFTVTAQPFCSFVSNPVGLVGPTRGTDFVCNVAGDGSIGSAWFVVASGSSGSYSVTVNYFGQVSAPVEFTSMIMTVLSTVRTTVIDTKVQSTTYSMMSTLSTVVTSTSSSYSTSRTTVGGTVTEYVTEFDTVYAYVLVILAHLQKAVGGFIEPVNKLTVVAPYLALFGVIAAVAIVVVWKKRDN